MYTSVCNIHVLGAKIINSRKAPRDRRREVDGERESERETEKRNGEREITDGDRNEQSRIIARNGIVIFKESHKDTRHGERERETVRLQYKFWATSRPCLLKTQRT